MERRLYQDLLVWKNKRSRKPLLLFGARQVGKTFLLKTFAARAYAQNAFIDFSRDSQAAALFAGSLKPKDIVRGLEAYLRMSITPDNTLIVLDEVQLCEEALTALKYFCEEAPEYHVVAAGSLLGVKLHRDRSLFPVGKVDLLSLQPLSFDEYLAARGEERLGELIALCLDEHAPCPLHERAIELYREYLLVGGMPEAVNAFLETWETGDISAYNVAREKQLAIDQAYLADIAKYAEPANMPRIIEAWQSIPRQLAKENHKFQYKTVRSGGRATWYEQAISWLGAAGITCCCTRVSEGVAPLETFVDPSAFKLYKVDTGLLSSSYHALPQDVLPQPDKAARFRGGLTENYVMQQLRSFMVQAYYWGTASTHEVEFIARDRSGSVIPIEVKSGRNVTSKSLKAYCDSYRPPYAVRLSTRNFGYEGNIRSIPLYAAPYLARGLLTNGPTLGFML